ncbi:hypothetical protein Dsin_030016 [Dipteronia sinensis]|uniref:Uncharacterized protein n=1 Tax=Dipteronia sinensis TaxID=43782 RepID=A0AAD9ZJS9_9ROSI|nr:hypothetical protein Dsin_030016 [Dipteronia sinensis]
MPKVQRVSALKGHREHVTDVAFYHVHNHLATASVDRTVRLWSTREELLLQESHSKSVYGLAFYHDGSLAASYGLDAKARVWDLRTRRSLFALEGHVKPVRLQTCVVSSLSVIKS